MSTPLPDQTPIQPLRCPYCQRRIARQFNLHGEALALQGQLCICVSCSGTSVFDQGALRKPTVEELHTLLENPQIRVAVAGIMRGLAQNRHFRS